MRAPRPFLHPATAAVLVAAALAAQGCATGSAPAARPAPVPFRLEPDPGAATAPLSVEPPGLPFTVLVDLPGFAMFRPRSSEDGTGWLVVGQDAEAGIVASVTVTSAGAAPGAAGARACRDATLARVRTAAPELGELVLDGSEDAARAAYVLREGGADGRSARHAHAFLVRDGACVDVHVSSAGSGDAERVEAILASIRFGARI